MGNLCLWLDLDKPYICVFVKGSDESLANFIAFFTHTGQLQMKVEYEHRYTLRQLICDESPKGNCICMFKTSFLSFFSTVILISRGG